MGGMNKTDGDGSISECVDHQYCPLQKSVMIYDTATDSWSTSTAPDMPEALTGQCAAAVDGKSYIMGGNGHYPGVVSNNTQIFDPATNKWSMGPLAAENCARNEFGLAVLDGTIHSVGSNNCNVIYSDVRQCHGVLEYERYGHSGFSPARSVVIAIGGGFPPQPGCCPFLACCHHVTPL